MVSERCARCGKGGAKHHVLWDYEEDGGWVQEAYLCDRCADEIAQLMVTKKKINRPTPTHIRCYNCGREIPKGADHSVESVIVNGKLRQRHYYCDNCW